jgi:hypothetical protein
MICHAQNPETCELLWSAGDADAFIRPGQSAVTRPVTRNTQLGGDVDDNRELQG